MAKPPLHRPTYKLGPEKCELLHKAIRRGDVECVKDLLQNTDVDQAIRADWTPMLYACQAGEDTIVEYLLENGAEAGLSFENYTPLMAVCSAEFGDEDKLARCVQLLVNHGARVNDTDRYSVTPLMHACWRGHEKIVRILIASQCNINEVDNEGKSALHYAVLNNHANIVQLLLENNAISDLQDMRGQDPLSIAVTKDLTDLVKILDKSEETQEDVVIVPLKSSYEEMVSELPCSNSVNGKGGFPSAVQDLLRGVGLDHFTKSFVAKNVQLAEYLNLTNKELKEMGVKLSMHRQQIIEGNLRFHRHGWNPALFPDIRINSKVEIFDVVRVLANSVKHLNIIWASTHYATKRMVVDSSSPKVEDLYQVTSRTVRQLDTILKELRSIHSSAMKLHQLQDCAPADLIKPKPMCGVKGKKKLIFISVVIGYVAWKTNVFKFLPQRIACLKLFS